MIFHRRAKRTALTPTVAASTTRKTNMDENKDKKDCCENKGEAKSEACCSTSKTEAKDAKGGEKKGKSCCCGG
jgi:hypothetical protein